MSHNHSSSVSHFAGWFISQSLIVCHLFVYLQELLKINYKTDLFKQLVVWLVTYSKARFQLSANWDRRFGILCHEFGHPPVTSLMDEKETWAHSLVTPRLLNYNGTWKVGLLLEYGGSGINCSSACYLRCVVSAGFPQFLHAVLG